MNKLGFHFICWMLMLGNTTVFADSRAVEININGIGPAVDAAAFGAVRQVIGHAVADGIVDKFIVNSYGIEGGFSACAQASPQTKEFVFFVRQLRSIVPSPKTTAYSVNPVVSCTNEVTFCTQDAKLCPDGSYVSRIPPSCEFAPCPAN
ncbi:MAG: hypothetical protein Q7U57_11645 [Methylovulum sp.]|nr:hypothetical protein [Methylovulum sp.]